MSRKIEERARALAEREAAIKQELLGQGLSPRNKVVLKNALIGGMIGLAIYFMFKPSGRAETSKEVKKPKKAKTSLRITERIISLMLPYLAKLLEEWIAGRKEQKVETGEEEEQKRLDVH